MGVETRKCGGNAGRMRGQTERFPHLKWGNFPSVPEFPTLCHSLLPVFLLEGTTLPVL
jgi:hypothetical protein